MPEKTNTTAEASRTMPFAEVDSLPILLASASSRLKALTVGHHPNGLQPYPREPRAMATMMGWLPDVLRALGQLLIAVADALKPH